MDSLRSSHSLKGLQDCDISPLRHPEKAGANFKANENSETSCIESGKILSIFKRSFHSSFASKTDLVSLPTGCNISLSMPLFS